LWVDIDRLDGLDEALARVGVKPTFLYESGNKGYWAIWAIVESVNTDHLEAATKTIAAIVGGDRGAAERSRLGRIPGSLNRTSGRAGRIISATWDRHPWDAFRKLDAPVRKGPIESDASPGAAPTLEFTPARTAVSLTPSLEAYVKTHQTVSHAQGGKYDRSAMEQKIYVCLLSQGHERGVVLTLCRDVYRLPRLLEDLNRGNERRIIQSLDSAIAWVERDMKPRRRADPLRHHRRRREFLQLCASGRRTTDLITLAKKELGICERQVYNLLRRHRSAGYLSSSNELTPAGRKALARKGWFFPLPK
jgi:hypothetical protein